MRQLPKFLLGVVALASAGCQNGEFKMPDFSSWGGDAKAEKADANSATGGSASSSSGSTSSTGGSTTGGSSSASSGSTSSSGGGMSGSSSDSSGGAGMSSDTSGSGAGAYSAQEPTEPQNAKDSVDVSGTESWAWSDAKVGWMVRHKMQGGMEMVQEVKDLDDKRLLMLNKTYMNGSLLSASLMWSARYLPKYTGEVVKNDCTSEDLSDETLTIAGKSVKCKVTRGTCTVNGEKIVTKSWMSDDVPGTMVKVESEGAGQPQGVVMELVDFKKT